MLNRREFLKLSSLAAMYAGGTVAFSPSNANAANIPTSGGYKAIVCILLNGGNDGFNMFIPKNTEKYNTYNQFRGDIAVNNTSLILPSLNTQKISSNPYNSTNKSKSYLSGVYDINLDLSVNGVMPELAHLIKNGKSKIISNIGNLVKPVTKDTLETDDLPLFLFAHNYQMRQIEIGRADNIVGAGWAGQIADNWFGNESDSSYPLGLNISLSSNNNLLIGKKTTPLIMSPSGPKSFDEMKIDRNYNRRAIFSYLSGTSINATGNINGYNPLDFTSDSYETSNYMEKVYRKLNNKSLDLLTDLSINWSEIKSSLTYSSTDSYGNQLFDIPNSNDIGWEIKGDLIKQLDAISTMIQMGKEKGYGRQIFVANFGGFDSHSDMAESHPALLREISLGLDKFNTAMVEKGLSDNVVTMTMSEFGRTVSNNGDGTDHGWGNHQIVMGGGMNTREIIGEVPDFTLGGVDDYSDKGRIIPKIATEQLNATVAKWFGVTNTELNDIFPNLKNFQKDSTFNSALINNLFS